MNKIEEIKSERDGLDVGEDIPRFAQLGFEAIEEGDLERIPNGITNASQLRAIGGIAGQLGRGMVD